MYEYIYICLYIYVYVCTSFVIGFLGVAAKELDLNSHGTLVYIYTHSK